jgi:hypothetical protein
MLASMDSKPVIVVSFVHGNALGVILEPDSAAQLPDTQRTKLWKVCIGPLVEEVARASEFPTDDFAKVIVELKQFLDRRGVPDLPITHD